MTTKAQKDVEERFVQMFLDGLTEYTSIDQGERPDFWVRRNTAPAIALEVTEYHPQPDTLQGLPRVAIEARWWKELGPVIDEKQRARPTLQGVRVFLGFKDRKPPHRKAHASLADELVRLVEAVIANDAEPAQDLEVVLLPRVTAAAAAAAGYFDRRTAALLPQENWPEASRYLSFLRVSSLQLPLWLPWQCMDVAGAWVGASGDELQRILEGKAAKAQGYDLHGSPLWLLIVCEVHGDLESHIFPQNDQDIAELAEALDETGFDFQKGPFAEVWLLSAFSRTRRRLYPPPSTS